MLTKNFTFENFVNKKVNLKLKRYLKELISSKNEVINWLGSDWSFDNIAETLQELANGEYLQKQLREDIKSSQND